MSNPYGAFPRLADDVSRVSNSWCLSANGCLASLELRRRNQVSKILRSLLIVSMSCIYFGSGFRVMPFRLFERLRGFAFKVFFYGAGGEGV